MKKNLFPRTFARIAAILTLATALALGPFSFKPDFLTQHTSPISLSAPKASAATIAFVQGKGTSEISTSTCGISLSSSVTAGDFLVFTLHTNSSTVTSTMVDNKGNTWQVAKNTTTSQAETETIFYAMNAAAGATNATATITNWKNAYRTCEFAEYSGIATTNALDVTNASSASSGTLWTSGTSTTNSANELIIGAGGIPSSVANVVTPRTGFSFAATSSPNYFSFQEYEAVSSAGQYSATVNGTSTTHMMAMATFNAGQPAVPGVARLSIKGMLVISGALNIK